jgi:hypothetical protein
VAHSGELNWAGAVLGSVARVGTGRVLRRGALRVSRVVMRVPKGFPKKCRRINDGANTHRAAYGVPLKLHETAQCGAHRYVSVLPDMLGERQPFSASTPQVASAVCFRERISHDQNLRWQPAVFGHRESASRTLRPARERSSGTKGRSGTAVRFRVLILLGVEGSRSPLAAAHFAPCSVLPVRER